MSKIRPYPTIYGAGQKEKERVMSIAKIKIIMGFIHIVLLLVVFLGLVFSTRPTSLAFVNLVIICFALALLIEIIVCYLFRKNKIDLVCINCGLIMRWQDGLFIFLLEICPHCEEKIYAIKKPNFVKCLNGHPLYSKRKIKSTFCPRCEVEVEEKDEAPHH